MDNPETIFIDTETTGINHPEIVSIGVVDADGNALLDKLILPVGDISPEAVTVHGITLKGLLDANAPTFANVIDDLNKILSDADQVGIYNANFDVHALLFSAWMRGVHVVRFEPVCVMREYHQYWFGEQADSQRWLKLTAACEQQGIPVEGAHGALADAQMTAKLYKLMQSGEARRLGDGGPVVVGVASIGYGVDKNGKAYLSLKSEGDQKFNVFSSNYHLLTDKGYPVEAWLRKLQELLDPGQWQPLSNPIQCQIEYNQYIDLKAVHSTWSK